MASIELSDRQVWLTKWASDRGVSIEVREFPEGTRTAVDAASAIGCDLAQIVKSLVFTVGARPAVVLMAGDNRVDEGVLSQLAGGGGVERADAATVREATGYPIGGVPPFAHAGDPDVYMDAELLDHKIVWAAAGTPSTVFPINSTDLARVTHATVSPLAQH